MPNLPIAQIATFAGLTILAVVLLGAGVFIYASSAIMRLPKNTPENFLKNGRPPSRRRVVVCAGASMVQGRIGSSFVDLLARRLPGYDFVNAGYNGDMALHLLQRLDPIIACRPDAIAILVGTNDAIGTLDTEAWRRYRGEKRLAGPPSLDRYRDTMREIVRQLKARTTAPIALCALPVLGEDLDSLPNRRIGELNAALYEVAEAEAVSYLPMFDREAALLAEHQQATRSAGKAFTPVFWVYGRIMFLAALQHYLLGRDFDDVSRRNGLLLKTDLIHGNNRETAIIADEIEAFLKSTLAD
jgi:acyl-CoA thioesterase-1